MSFHCYLFSSFFGICFTFCSSKGNGHKAKCWFWFCPIEIEADKFLYRVNVKIAAKVSQAMLKENQWNHHNSIKVKNAWNARRTNVLFIDCSDNRAARILEKLEELFTTQQQQNNVADCEASGDADGAGEEGDGSEDKQLYNKQQIVVKYLEV